MKHRLIFVNFAGKFVVDTLVEGESAQAILESLLPSDSDNEIAVRGEWQTVSVKGGDWSCSIRARSDDFWAVK